MFDQDRYNSIVTSCTNQDGSVDRRHLTLEMLRDSRTWVYDTVLPLKHVTKRDRGIPLHSYVRVSPTVYLGEIFMPSTEDEQVRYDSCDAIVNDGWRID